VREGGREEGEGRERGEGDRGWGGEGSPGLSRDRVGNPDRIGSEPRHVGRLGSGLRVSASFTYSFCELP